MKAIVAVDMNWGIGYKGNLLERIPEDMQFFKQVTLGKVVVMGRETFESLPHKEPLKNRVNIILSQNKCFKNERVIVCRSLDELFQELAAYNSDDVFVIGGESVYSQLLPYCTEAFVTKIEREYAADKHFVNIEREGKWELTTAGELKQYHTIQFRFFKYLNKSVKRS